MKHRFRARFRPIAAAVVSGLLPCLSSVHATTYIWDGDTTEFWNNAANWDALPVSGGGHTLVFNAAGTAVANQTGNDLADPFSLNALTVGASMTFSGSAIEFAGTTPAANFAAGITLTFDCGLKISTANTTFRSSVAGTNTSTIIFNGQLTGGQTLRYANTSPASTSPIPTFKFAYGGGANTISGFTMGDGTSGRGAGKVQIAMDDPFGASGTTFNLANAGNVTVEGLTSTRSIASGIMLRGNLTFTGKSMDFKGNWTTDTGGARTLTNNLDAGETLTLASNSGATFNGSRLTIQGAGTTVIPGVLSDSVGNSTYVWAKSGTGTVRLTGLNTYPSQTKVPNGTLEFNSVENKSATPTACALGKPVADGAKEVIALGSTTTAGTLKYIGTVGGGHSTDRPLDLAGTTGGGTVDASGTGPISFLGGVTASGFGNKILTLAGSNTGDNTLGGDVIDSAGFATSLVKSGGGKWILTGTKSYMGTTTVNGGTLQVDGSITGTASTTVKDTATLGGSGTVVGTLAVESGGTVAPGSSVGTLTNSLTGGKAATFASANEFASAAKFAFELGAPGTNDALAFTGLTADTVSVTFTGNVINFTNAGGLATGTYTLFTFDADNAYTGTLVIGTGLEAFTPSLIYHANSIQLKIDPGTVPLSTVSIVRTADGAEEGPVHGQFTVSRTNASLPVTVLYTVTGTAATGSDYTALPGSLTLDAEVASATIPVTVHQDNDFTEGAETVIVTLTTDAAYTVGTPDSATVDIADGIKPVVTIVQTADCAEAGPSNGAFTVSRPAGESSNYALTVNYTVDAGSTAIPGDDYSALAGSVVIPANENSATVTVPVLQDTDFGEGPETVVLNLTADAAYAISGSGSATVSITDGVKPVVTITKTTDGAEAGPASGVFTVTRSTDNGTGTALTVTYTVNGSSTASAGTDYTALSGSVVIGSGLTTATITVPVLQDTDFAEGAETVVLDLASSPGYSVGDPASATMSLADGIKPEITIVKTTDGDESGPVNGVFTVSRSPGSASSGPVTVLYAATGTADAGSDYTALSGSVVIPLNATTAAITVPVLHDFLFSEGMETVIVTITASAGYAVGTPDSATVDIADISGGAPVVGNVNSFTATYPFTDTVAASVTDPTPPPYEKGIIFSPFSMHGNGSNGIAGRFYANNWNPGGSSSVFQPGQYFTVTLTPGAAPGLVGKMTLDTITFDVARQNQGGNGPLHYAVRSSIDDYAANLTNFTIDPANPDLTTVDGASVTIVGADTGAGTWQTGAKLTLGPSFANLTTPVTFRIYGWAASQGKDGGIDNFEIKGSWVVNSTGAPGYSDWATTTHGLSGADAAFDFDYDKDGLDNGLEYVLGGDPKLNDAADIMPRGNKDNTDYVFTYQRSDASQADTTQVVQYGNDLDGWTPVMINAAGGSSGGATYTVDEGTPATDPDTIIVTIPTGGATEFFARLKVSQP